MKIKTRNGTEIIKFSFHETKAEIIQMTLKRNQ